MEQQLDRLWQEQMKGAPYRRIEGDWTSGVLILCNHADNRIPLSYGTLGLAPEDLSRHIAYDIGAAGVTEHLARALGAPALLTRFSRLLIDPNRGLDDPTLIMQLSDWTRGAGQRRVGRGGDRDAGRSLLRAVSSRHRRCRRHGDRGGQAAGAGRDPQLHASLEERAETLACGGAVEQGSEACLSALKELQVIPDVTVGDNVPYIAVK